MVQFGGFVFGGVCLIWDGNYKQERLYGMVFLSIEFFILFFSIFRQFIFKCFKIFYRDIFRDGKEIIFIGYLLCVSLVLCNFNNFKGRKIIWDKLRFRMFQKFTLSLISRQVRIWIQVCFLGKLLVFFLDLLFFIEKILELFFYRGVYQLF